jgi:hypothetical protein
VLNNLKKIGWQAIELGAIVVLLSMPGEKRHSLYFGDGDMVAQTVDLRR